MKITRYTVYTHSQCILLCAILPVVSDESSPSPHFSDPLSHLLNRHQPLRAHLTPLTLVGGREQWGVCSGSHSRTRGYHKSETSLRRGVNVHQYLSPAWGGFLCRKNNIIMTSYCIWFLGTGRGTFWLNTNIPYLKLMNGQSIQKLVGKKIWKTWGIISLNFSNYDSSPLGTSSSFLYQCTSTPPWASSLQLWYGLEGGASLGGGVLAGLSVRVCCCMEDSARLASTRWMVRPLRMDFNLSWLNTCIVERCE